MSSAVCVLSMCKMFLIVLLLNVVFNQRLSSVKNNLLSKVDFCQRSSSLNVFLPSNVVFRQSLSSVKGYLLSKVVFCPRLSSVKVCLSSYVVFRQRLSSVKGCLPSKLSYTNSVSAGLFTHQFSLFVFP